jgi:hypothetical protein
MYHIMSDRFKTELWPYLILYHGTLPVESIGEKSNTYTGLGASTFENFRWPHLIQRWWCSWNQIVEDCHFL